MLLTKNKGQLFSRQHGNVNESQVSSLKHYTPRFGRFNGATQSYDDVNKR